MENIQFWKDIIDIVQSLVTILAICGGAFLYYQRRRRFPRTKITHQVADKLISPDRVLLRVVITVSNQGEVLLSLESGFVGVQQVSPCPQTLLDSIGKSGDIVKEGKHEAAWDTLAEREITFSRREREIEPGEEEEFNFDFLIDADVKTVIVYSYFKNESKKRREIGWNKTTLYDLSTSCEQSPEEVDMSQDRPQTPPPQPPPPKREERQAPPRERPQPRQSPQSPPGSTRRG